MNPVLLKPETDTGAQVIVQGRRSGTLSAQTTIDRKAALLLPPCSTVLRAWRAMADLVLVEGAGSPAEINLRAGDIANMGFAEAADCPVVLVGDIDRGGVIASLVGTHAVLDAGRAGAHQGFLVNKFRGDPDPVRGRRDRRSRAGPAGPALGVVPWLPDAAVLPAEDALDLARSAESAGRALKVAVPVLAAHRQFRRPRPARPGARRRRWSWCGRASRCRATPTS